MSKMTHEQSYPRKSRRAPGRQLMIQEASANRSVSLVTGCRSAATGYLMCLMLALAALPVVAAASETPRLSVVERTLTQDQGGWVVNYRLRYHGSTGFVVAPTEMLVRVEGWVSNSRVAAHAVPRWSSIAASGATGLSGAADVVAASDESQRCRERAVVQVWTDDSTRPAEPPSIPSSSSSTTRGPTNEPRQPLLSIAPGAIVHVRLRLEHLHFLYGDYDPLLGVRTLELHLGGVILRDALPLDCEQYLAQPRYSWPAPPEDRRDTRHFISAPDSLHLEAHIPGNQYYRFPERPVRYGTRMRLRYWYYIAAGTEGECRARVAQYKDTPAAWKVLSEGGSEECLGTIGRWVKVERVFRTEPDATTLALDFRISGSEVGEMWVDDVSLEPLSGSTSVGP
jgi:hypothetical protein